MELFGITVTNDGVYYGLALIASALIGLLALGIYEIKEKHDNEDN